MAGLTRLTSPPVTVPSSTRHGCLVLASAPFGLPGRWQTCRCAERHWPQAGVLAQVQVDQVQPAQLTDPQAPVRQPGHHQPVPGGLTTPSSRSRAPSGSIFGCRRRGPGRGQRVSRHRRGFTCPRNDRRRSARDGSPPRQPRAQFAVHAERGLVQVEALQARRRSRESGRGHTVVCRPATVRPRACGPRPRPGPCTVPGPAAPPRSRARHSRSSHRR